MSDRLVAFIKARLDEDAAAADHSGPARVAWLTYRDNEGQMLYTTVAAGDDHIPWVADGRELPPPASARVVYDPARALRDVEADRRLLDLYERARQYRDRVFARPEPRSISDEMRAVTQMMALEQVMRLRAAIYSGHADYAAAVA